MGFFEILHRNLENQNSKAQLEKIATFKFDGDHSGFNSHIFGSKKCSFKQADVYLSFQNKMGKQTAFHLQTESQHPLQLKLLQLL